MPPVWDQSNGSFRRAATCTCIRRSSVVGMAASTRRVRRPIGTETIAVHLFLTPEVKNRIDAYARQADVPQWAIVEAAILAGEPDSETGIPKGWDLPDNGATSLPGVSDGGGAVRSSP